MTDDVVRIRLMADSEQTIEQAMLLLAELGAIDMDTWRVRTRAGSPGVRAYGRLVLKPELTGEEG